MVFRDAAEQVLRLDGGRVTSQRRIVIDVLADMSESLDVESIHQLASQYDTNLNLTTVYRILNTLEQAGLVHQRYISRSHDRKVYQRVNTEQVFHFTCRECGKTIPFQSNLVNVIKMQLATDQHIQVDYACVCFSGLCTTCRENQENLEQN